MDKLIELSSTAEIVRFEGAWRDLTKRAASYSMVQTYEYALAALKRAQETSTRSFLALVEDGGRAIGIWGFTLTRQSLLRTLEPFSHGSHEERSGPLLEAGKELEAAERILRLVTSVRADRVILYNIDPRGPIAAASSNLGLRARDRHIVAMTIPAHKYLTWESVEKELSKGIRTELRRRARRLEELEPTRKLRLRWRCTPEESDQAIDFFIEHKTRWAREHKKRARWLKNPAGLALFFKHLCRIVDLSVTPVIATIDLGDTPIAASLCLVGSSDFEYAFTTYDETFAKYGPGKLLLRYLVEWTFTRRCDFSFGLMTADYKEEWPVEPFTYVTRIIPISPLGLIKEPSEIVRDVRSILGPYKRRAINWTTRQGDRRLSS